MFLKFLSSSFRLLIFQLMFLGVLTGTGWSSENLESAQNLSLNPSSNIRPGFSVGAGWPYFGLKYYFNNDIGSEFRYSFGEGIEVLAGRGYWSFKKFGNFSLFTGLEGGYVTFDAMNTTNTLKVTGTGYEVSPFLGIDYFLDKRVSFSMDFSMPVVSLKYKADTLSDLQWVTSGAVYFYPF